MLSEYIEGDAALLSPGGALQSPSKSTGDLAAGC